MKNRHTLSVLVEDHPGVLNRVVSCCAALVHRLDHGRALGAAGYLAHDDRGHRPDEEVEQAGKQLYKLMEVLKVIDVRH